MTILVDPCRIEELEDQITEYEAHLKAKDEEIASHSEFQKKNTTPNVLENIVK